MMLDMGCSLRAGRKLALWVLILHFPCSWLTVQPNVPRVGEMSFENDWDMLRSPKIQISGGPDHDQAGFINMDRSHFRTMIPREVVETGDPNPIWLDMIILYDSEFSKVGSKYLLTNVYIYRASVLSPFRSSWTRTLLGGLWNVHNFYGTCTTPMKRAQLLWFI